MIGLIGLIGLLAQRYVPYPCYESYVIGSRFSRLPYAYDIVKSSIINWCLPYDKIDTFPSLKSITYMPN